MENHIKTKLCTEGVINNSLEEKEFAEKVLMEEKTKSYNPLHDNNEKEGHNVNLSN